MPSVSCSCLTRSSKFSDEGRCGRHGTPPVGVAACWRVGDRYHHRPRSYAALGDSATDSFDGRAAFSPGRLIRPGYHRTAMARRTGSMHYEKAALMS